MAFVKVQKNSVYCKRFQVHFRRRRIGKTDYYQRKRLILQRKNKYNTPKYRFVVRRTNQRIICQVVWSTLQGDKVKAQADSFELKNFGVTAGLTNYAAAYATGLLTARRLLTLLDKENKEVHKFDSTLAKDFDFVKEADGKDFDFKKLCEEKDTPFRPFTCYLDLGLVRATKGNRVFAAMKGALDGGINIPHEAKIFPSPSHKKEKEEETKKPKKGEKDKKKEVVVEKEEEEFDGAMLRDRIFGVHVQKWMDTYTKKKDAQPHQFSEWKNCLKNAKVKSIEELYKKVHSEIKKNPLKKQEPEKKYVYKRSKKDKNIVEPEDKDKKPFRRDKRLTHAERKKRIQDKIAQFKKQRK